MTDVLGKTTVCSFYQASESMYNLFDRVAVMDKGRLIYFGPAKEAKQYFVGLGFKCEPRKSTPDFLSMSSSPFFIFFEFGESCSFFFQPELRIPKKESFARNLQTKPLKPPSNSKPLGKLRKNAKEPPKLKPNSRKKWRSKIHRKILEMKLSDNDSHGFTRKVLTPLIF